MIWFVLQIILFNRFLFGTGNGRRYKTDVNIEGMRGWLVYRGIAKRELSGTTDLAYLVIEQFFNCR
jgi:hypothetical protein